jgi:hypothetical protein
VKLLVIEAIRKAVVSDTGTLVVKFCTPNVPTCASCPSITTPHVGNLPAVMMVV